MGSAFHDYFSDDPYMIVTVIALIIFEIILVFFLIKRDPRLRSFDVITSIRNYFQSKKTKPPPSKEVDVTITNENQPDLRLNKISDKLSEKMSNLDKMCKELPQETINDL